MVGDNSSYVLRLSRDHFPDIALIDRRVTNEIRRPFTGAAMDFDSARGSGENR
jgi:hypothetical protein